MPLCGGTQLAVQTTHVSALTAAGASKRHAGHCVGPALRIAWGAEVRHFALCCLRAWRRRRGRSCALSLLLHVTLPQVGSASEAASPCAGAPLEHAGAHRVGPDGQIVPQQWFRVDAFPWRRSCQSPPPRLRRWYVITSKVQEHCIRRGHYACATLYGARHVPGTPRGNKAGLAGPPATAARFAVCLAPPFKWAKPLAPARTHTGRLHASGGLEEVPKKKVYFYSRRACS